MLGGRDTISSREINRDEKIGASSTCSKSKWSAARDATKLGPPPPEQDRLKKLAGIAYDRNQEQPLDLEDVKGISGLPECLLRKRGEKAQGSLERQIYNTAYNIASMTQHNNYLLVKRGEKIWMDNKNDPAVIQALKAAIKETIRTPDFAPLPHDQQSEIQAIQAEKAEKNKKRNRITIKELKAARDVFSPDSTDYQELHAEIQAIQAEKIEYRKIKYITIEELKAARDVFSPDSTDYQELHAKIQAIQAEKAEKNKKRNRITIEELKAARDVFSPDSTDYQELHAEIQAIQAQRAKYDKKRIR